MTAAILSIGDELVTGQTIDTNASHISRQLSERGIPVTAHVTVSDDRQTIAREIERLAGRNRILIVTGGLGPTPDDLTREGLADVVSSSKLETDDDALEQIQAWFERTGRRMTRNNARQALKPVGTRILKNSRGTAPGLRCEYGGCTIAVLPGVPTEMRAMLDGVLDDIAPRSGQTLACVAVRTIGIGESALATMLDDLLRMTGSIRAGTTSSRGEVAVRLYGEGDKVEVDDALNRIATAVEQKLFPYSFGRESDTIAVVLGSMLRDRGWRLATVESCTGGMIGSMLTDAAGSSDFYLGGWVTYANSMKASEVGVSQAALDGCGAVSREVAREMARGALRESGADIAIGVTGVAGPGGASSTKPVGTVYISIAYGESEEQVQVRRFQFSGDRAMIRERAAKTALQLARFVMLEATNSALLGEVDE